MNRSRLLVTTLGAFPASLGFAAAFMRWAPLEPTNRLLLGALLFVPAYAALACLGLIAEERWAWATCALLVGLGIAGALT